MGFEEEQKQVNVAILGAAGVGKSALTVRLITGRFLHHYDPTLEDQYHTEMEVDGEAYSVNVLDTAGQEQTNLRYYLSTSDVLLLAFSLSDLTTLDSAKEILKFANGFYGRQSRLPVLLVGTKQDLAKERKISAEDAMKAAEELNCSYIETSAVSNAGVSEAFQTAVRLAAQNMASLEPQPPTYGLPVDVEKKLLRSPKRSVKGLLQRISSLRKNKKQQKLIDSCLQGV